jgi:alpha-aminoadipate carrier protein LysW
MTICPQCESDLDIDEETIEEGEIVTCLECDSRYEIVSAEPLELSQLEEEDEDEEDDLDDDDDDE